MILYKDMTDRMFGEMKFQASIHGINLEEELRKQGVEMPKQKEAKPTGFQFGDPEEYKKMPQAERDALTKRMMSHYKGWAKQAPGVEAVEKR